MTDMHIIGIYPEEYDGQIADDPYAIGDGIYYDGGLYGLDGGPDHNQGPDDSIPAK
ncbi:hypothetical protein V2W30_39755 (plasmid) [Streptomyces sp. Q6]|uniref:Uncharacterized protein n=1 Tax=Streptomyces citrinus TaxID=3118173 RepID=A0ACD5AQK5_9ACTN